MTIDIDRPRKTDDSVLQHDTTINNRTQNTTLLTIDNDQNDDFTFKSDITGVGRPSLKGAQGKPNSKYPRDLQDEPFVMGEEEETKQAPKTNPTTKNPA